ncbi:50S ribosomal protein L24e [Halolamina sp.]|uniref:50S ribosomal protein L24e n=1 Tax=Halolamina sp. TaxID=1940283 RepID=UPI0031F30527
MPQTRDCDYCGAEIEPGTGTMLVHVNGSVTHFCSAKCEKNADLGREPRDLEWTEEGGDHGVQAAATEGEETEAEETEPVESEAEVEAEAGGAEAAEEAASEAAESGEEEAEAAAEDDEETEE